ncbi:MAG: Rne/Rng family ribonuclease [Acetobacteraceae bacterium]|nr:Rne/Rng family ribonuclease [Acetobacteraceae bacterium]
MTKRMLIDSTHAEETRVVVLDGNRLEEFDVETSTKRQLKGNIYLAKVVRVEPSLQAAFVEYGGNRHGFLAFGEIHPDYYQIPVADRKRLLEAQEAEAREDEEEEERQAARARQREATGESEEAKPNEAAEPAEPETFPEGELTGEGESAPEARNPEPIAHFEPTPAEAGPAPDPDHRPIESAVDPLPRADQVAQPLATTQDVLVASPEEAAALFPEEDVAVAAPEPIPEGEGADMAPEATASIEPGEREAPEPAGRDENGDIEVEEVPPEQIGGETDVEEHQARRSTPRFLRNYKIQEVIRRRQIMLVQVVKEERGNKGAALTTYISLAGRFCVLMPNSPRGGGISRKITSPADRRRLKEVTAELDLPRGMGLIIRTAGANRPKPEILRDCEYLLNQWDQIRELTMKSVAPALIYEEASLIKRAIRDMYSRDVDDILVDGEQGWRGARDFMRMLMPTHARKVQLWKDPQPLFAKAQVEQQLEAMLQPMVQLKSGGYLVINQTEALVAIDVNSGRSTRERGIEETALRTNLEAADEAARQLRLRDLAGLVVIDFIDMESRRNVASVERRLKEALKHDRARIQVGSISHFGLLEMSRQRLRPSLTETNFSLCPHCGGTGYVRSTESTALHVLRAIEEEGGKRRAAEIVVHCASAVALYILNHKRQRLAEVEARHGMVVMFASDETLLPPAYRIEKVRAQVASEAPPPVQQLAPPEPFEDPDELELEAEEADEEEEAADSVPGETSEEREQRRGRRRRRRRGGRREDAAASPAAPEPDEAGAEEEAEPAPEAAAEAPAESGPAEAEEGERRRRGRRGGRRRRREQGEGDASSPATEAGDEEPAEATEPVAAYVGPTPADPFGGANAFDIFEAIEQAEEERARAPRPAPMEPEPTPFVEPETEAVFAEVSPAAANEAATAGEPTAAASEAQAAPEHVVIPEHASPQAEPEPAGADAVPPEPAAPEPAVPEPAVPEPAAAELAPPPPPAPVIVPILVGADAAPAEKKRGWWRR